MTLTSSIRAPAKKSPSVWKTPQPFGKQPRPRLSRIRGSVSQGHHEALLRMPRQMQDPSRSDTLLPRAAPGASSPTRVGFIICRGAFMERAILG
jgi:hypothetical protein